MKNSHKIRKMDTKTFKRNFDIKTCDIKKLKETAKRYNIKLTDLHNREEDIRILGYMT